MLVSDMNVLPHFLYPGHSPHSEIFAKDLKTRLVPKTFLPSWHLVLMMVGSPFLKPVPLSGLCLRHLKTHEQNKDFLHGPWCVSMVSFRCWMFVVLISLCVPRWIGSCWVPTLTARLHCEQGVV